MPGSTRSRPPRSGSAGQSRVADPQPTTERVIPIARKTRAVGRKAPAASKKLLGLVEKSLDDDKAEDVVAIDLSGKSSIADYMVIASGRSSRQLGAMAEHLQ